MVQDHFSARIGQRVSLKGHFSQPVILEDVRPLGTKGSGGYECRVRLPDGVLEETILSSEEASAIFVQEEIHEAQPADAERRRLLVESTRIRLAYAYDRQFAVSLSDPRNSF